MEIISFVLNNSRLITAVCALIALFHSLVQLVFCFTKNPIPLKLLDVFIWIMGLDLFVVLFVLFVVIWDKLLI